MLLFEKRFHEGLKSGAVTLTFRTWEKPHVKPGGRYRCHPIGVLEVDAVAQVRVAEISEKDAKRSGFATRAALLERISSGPAGALDEGTLVWRVELHYGGDGDRVAIALEDKLSDADVAEISAKLERMDAKHAWTRATLDVIEKHPRTAASRLAASLGRETAPFKADVVKLKKLGLTQSFEVGYELSPRGRAYRAAVAKKSKRARA